MAVRRFSNHLCVLDSCEQERQTFSHDVVIVCENDSRLALHRNLNRRRFGMTGQLVSASFRIELGIRKNMTGVRRLRSGSSWPIYCFIKTALRYPGLFSLSSCVGL